MQNRNVTSAPPGLQRLSTRESPLKTLGVGLIQPHGILKPTTTKGISDSSQQSSTDCYHLWKRQKRRIDLVRGSVEVVVPVASYDPVISGQRQQTETQTPYYTNRPTTGTFFSRAWKECQVGRMMMKMSRIRCRSVGWWCQA